MSAKIAILAGPTASGKTALACALANRLDAEIVSADSQQCYRGLDAGTAKPTAAEQMQARHHLLDIAWPEEQLDVAQFIEKADAAIADILSRKKRVLLVGGTGLWIRGLVQGLVDAPGRDDAFRAQLRARVQQEGLPALYQELQSKDPEAAAKILPGDLHRIERALEVHAATGQTLSSLQRAHRFAEKRYRARMVLLDPPPEALWARIAARTQAMLSGPDAPLICETRWLHARIAEIPAAEKALRIIGYGEAAAAIDKELTREALDEARELVAARTRQYAKRQRTWFKKDATQLDEGANPLSWPPAAIPADGAERHPALHSIDALCSALREWYEADP